MDELLKQVLDSESTKQIWRNDYSSLNWNNASKLNQILFNLPLNKQIGCYCIEDLFHMLNRPNINQKIKTIMSKQFKVKEGKLIQVIGHAHVSRHSSDELCISLLKRFPMHIENFESYPSDWKEIVENHVPRKAGEPIVEDVVEETESEEDSNESDGDYETNEGVESHGGLHAELSELKNSELKAELKAGEREFPKNANKAKLIELVIALRNDV